MPRSCRLELSPKGRSASHRSNLRNVVDGEGSIKIITHHAELFLQAVQASIANIDSVNEGPGVE